MKAKDLLSLVRESSKGTKHVDGEINTPTYDNLNTPDNHVDGKGTKEVKNAKKDFGKKRDKKNPANPGKPKKGERRGMEGTGKSYKRMNEQSPRSPEEVLSNTVKNIFQRVQDLDVSKGHMVVTQRTGRPITIKMDPATMKTSLAQTVASIRKAGNPKQAMGIWDKFVSQAQDQGSQTMQPRPTGGTAQAKPGTMTPRKWMKGQHTDWDLEPQAGQQGTRAQFGDSVGESYADTDSMSWDQKVKKGGPVSKTGKVRGKVDDEPTNKGDPGKPTNDGKGQMGDGANLGKIMNPKSVKKVEEGIKDLEKLLGTTLNIGEDAEKKVRTKATNKRKGGSTRRKAKKSFNRGSMPVQEGMDPVLAQYLRTALWSSTDMNTDMPMNHDYDVSDFSFEAIRQANADLMKFRAALSNDLTDELNMPSVAHDLWLVRNGHSRGFTDDDYSPEIGKLMTKLALQMGKIHPVVDDNNQIYFFKG